LNSDLLTVRPTLVASNMLSPRWCLIGMGFRFLPMVDGWRDRS
jgi:hypothetical protein